MSKSFCVGKLSKIIVWACIPVLCCCSPSDCFKRKGKTAYRTLLTNEFKKIEISGKTEVQLIQDSACYAEIYWYDNLMEMVSCVNHDGLLKVGYTNSCQSLRYEETVPLVKLHFKSLKEIIYSGANRVYSLNTLQGDTLHVNCWDGIDTVSLSVNYKILYANNHTGVADIVLKGSCTEAFLYNRDMGFIRAASLSSSFIWANNFSPGDIFAGPCDKLEVLIHYNGNVYYTGNPDIDIKEDSGKGQLIPL